MSKPSYFEKQEGLLCGKHAINNLFNKELFIYNNKTTDWKIGDKFNIFHICNKHIPYTIAKNTKNIIGTPFYLPYRFRKNIYKILKENDESVNDDFLKVFQDFKEIATAELLKRGEEGKISEGDLLQ